VTHFQQERNNLMAHTRKHARSANQPYSLDIQRPVSSLYFLLPLLIAYEVATLCIAGDIQRADESRVVAFEMLRGLLAIFGATPVYLPGLIVPVVLIMMNLADRGTWRVRLKTLVLMTFECIFLAVPLLVLSNLVGIYTSSLLAGQVGTAVVAHGDPAAILPSVTSDASPIASRMLLSVGAGIYEELIFRLGLWWLVNIVVADLGKSTEKTAWTVMVALSAIAFSAYHYMGVEPFAWSTFVFRALAGAYLALVFLLRGFGIAVGSHVLYNLLAIMQNNANE
jgi:hypothetical protein